MTAPSFYAIQAAMAAAQSALSRLEASGDVDTDEAAALAVLQEEAPDIDTVLCRLLRAGDEAQTNVEAVSARVAALEGRKARYARQHAEYRRTVFAMLDALGLRKWRNAEFSVSITDGRPGVVITDEAALPEQFVRVTKTPDKTAIACALQAGNEIPGAEMRNGMPSMRVNTK